MWNQIYSEIIQFNPFSIACLVLLSLGVMLFIWKFFGAVVRFSFDFLKIQNELLPLVQSKDLSLPLEYLRRQPECFPYNNLTDYISAARQPNQQCSNQLENDLLTIEYELVKNSGWFLFLASLSMLSGILYFMKSFWLVFTTTPVSTFFGSKIAFLSLYKSFGVLSLALITAASLYCMYFSYRVFASKSFDQSYLLFKTIKNRLGQHTNLPVSR